ncbi:alpha/beta fold hydrolase [Paenibacillus sp. GCM10023248]|uniref:alpha/beta fold hydrolase n=1 Tax=Bacillales TaxID=1385 RepID=UPI002378C4F4|nr:MULTISPECIES: alpha/beta fold hydrolase [Bacillales]MDD9266259.1 alpha/beta fold hydrolase [Paenibacillus sp. MAHUQ-63]MDR6878380.1 pimeloyl-[acyl-carrier protein] methyl ester esterase [Bacillus sp. 3255]
MSGTLLWLPGWSMTPAVFSRLQERLPLYRHLPVDLSDAQTPYELLRRAEAAAKESGGPLLIGGWSLGALLALRLAAQGLADGLILFAATACFVRSKHEQALGQPDSIVRQMIRALDYDAYAVETAFRKQLLTDAERRAGVEKRLAPAGSWTLPALHAGLELLRSEDLRQMLPDIQCPVLLFHGLADRICPFGGVSELAARLPYACLYAIPECGHAPFLDREEEIAKEVRRWLHAQQSDSASI